jgi:hypothetical protein
MAHPTNSLYAAHAIANSSILPSREELLSQLAEQEEALRSQGYDPYDIGHRIVPVGRTAHDYQDKLIESLKRRGAIPDDGKKFVERWRREATHYSHLKRGWARVEVEGTQSEWLKGVESAEEWADLMRRLNDWQAEYEERKGLPFVPDWDLIADFR